MRLCIVDPETWIAAFYTNFLRVPSQKSELVTLLNWLSTLKGLSHIFHCVLTNTSTHNLFGLFHEFWVGWRSRLCLLLTDIIVPESSGLHYLGVTRLFCGPNVAAGTRGGQL